MDKEVRRLVCHRVSKLSFAPGSIKETCSKCKHRVWVVPSNLALRADIICWDCMMPELEKAKAEGEEVKAQWANEALKGECN